MKTSFNHFLKLGVFFFLLSNFNLQAASIEIPLIPTIEIEAFDNDHPYSYAARIKRFHRPYKGMDYFAPAYVDLNSYSSILTFGLTIYNESPFDDTYLKGWSKNNGSIAMYRYYHDEYYRERVDMWNRIYNKSYLSPFGAFNYNYGFGLAGNPNSSYTNSLYNYFSWAQSFDYETDLNFYVNAALYGQTVILMTGKPAPTSTDALEKRIPVETTPIIKKEKVIHPVVSVEKTVEQKEDFYSHVTLTTSKRLPKNWRILSSELKAWYESPNLIPPPPIPPAQARKYTARKNGSSGNGPKASIPKTGIWNSSPQFGGGSSSAVNNTSSSSASTGRIHN